MFEISECQVLTRQMNDAIAGKVVQTGKLSNSPHKFVWHNLSHQDFAAQTAGKTIGQARALGRWMLIPFEPGYVMVIGEWGGKLQFLPAGTPALSKYHFLVTFTDDSMLFGLTQMWGAAELYPAGQEQERQYIKDARPNSLDDAFTFGYFTQLIDELLRGAKRSVKSLLTQDQLIPGLGNSVAQDIMFRAGLHPR
ncbi:MAG: hypothetical protein HPY76_12635 [Anaerolineae bacterium]|nr:hypothetical protein [Anaerolineae bacterium]